jgi:hypothetical protein
VAQPATGYISALLLRRRGYRQSLAVAGKGGPRRLNVQDTVGPLSVLCWFVWGVLVRMSAIQLGSCAHGHTTKTSNRPNKPTWSSILGLAPTGSWREVLHAKRRR